ncbi:hypothetical protein GCM10010503_33080 [Streptomyces lucensis JCM 4490]|uniref:Carrier domain-containing protein n=1 Tax=Streptomyces lucensis JCM 4490 TaxID=1306176 RepID=A0A918MS07_9ACTN|nr:non-ribosomal peptide synthetase [Streptomyces lucensis]GGW53275.1 hypothetical protein GCM10010503_33080 [Streptomyces lucensis JCM 4490]
MSTTLVALWEQRVASAPDSVAVVAGTRQATYAEVDRRATALAADLAARGIGPESLVGVCLERSIDMVVALLGILKSGAGYLPLDPSYPADRLRHMTTDSGAGLIVCDARHRERISSAVPEAAGLLPVEDVPDAPDAPFASPARPHHLAYVIYTSGSTGLPKGVAVDHAAITSFLHSVAERPGLAPDDRVLALTPLSFDISTLELFLPLTLGATVVMAPQAANTDPEVLAAAVEEGRVTVVQATPTTWRMLVASGWRAGRGRTLLSGGEPLDARLARDLLATGGTLWNLYGPTEATVWATAARVDEADERVTVGTALSNTRLHVVDEHGREVGPGVTGELWIGGRGVARGYLNRPALTADRFVPDAFGDGSGRLYRTGDLARWTPTGDLELLGRNDHQVKVRGHRIELGEIEACVRSHPEVADAVVVVDREATGGDQLVAFLVAAPGTRGTEDLPRRVRDHLAGRLPAHMVAQGWAVLDALPRTPAGKADRGAVLALGYRRIRDTAAGHADGPLPPHTDTVRAVWAEVLGLAEVSPYDDFFALGGQSLAAVRAVTRLREELGLPLGVQEVFAHPAPASLAAALDGFEGAEEEPIGPATRAELSFGQERIWFFEQVNEGVPAYHLPVALSFPGGRVETSRLQRALTALVDRHQALRTALVAADGRVRPEPHADVPVPVRCTEVSEEALDDLITERIRAPFALDRAPLLRADVLRTPRRDVLLLTIHHIACDGTSVDLLVRELGDLYTGRPLAAAPDVSYADFAQWERERIGGAELERLLAHWRKRLAGVPALELPTSRPRPAVAGHRGRRTFLRVPAGLAGRLRALCRAEGVTLFMGLMAPLQVLLGRYADETDVAVGTLLGGRPRPETAGVCGYFVNTAVLRTDLSGDPTWTDLLGRVREVARDAYAHQELPFEKLVAELCPERDLSRNPLFQVLFALHEEPPAGVLTEVYDRKELEGRLGTARFDLAFDVTDHAVGDGGLSISVEYATDLFDEDFAEGLGRHFVRVIEQMVADADARLSELQVLSAAELRALSAGDLAEPLPEPSTLVRLWERQVRETPDQVCVVGDGATLTYAETDRRAAALARTLRAAGVGPEQLVGVCLERSVELVVALLGVLKAGGAYVPLDPGYPADRLRYLLEDSGVRLVVADPAHPSAALFDGAARVVPVAREAGGTEEPAGPHPVEEAQPHHLAYVIYTSGSTGKPKGVAITHANITGFLAWNQRLCGLTGDDRALLNHSVAFDNSVWEIFQCLVSGAQLHLAGPTAAYDPEAFLREVAERGITTLNATPSQLRILLESGADCAARLASVRLVFTGAEAVPHDVARRIMEVTPDGCRIFNEYGPTEATVTSAFCPITEDLLDRHAHRPSVPFGQATDNARLYVLDARLRPVVPGCRGELYVGGDAVGRGYLGKPARTAQAYLPDPFAEEPGARMYATGDVVRLLPDGNLVFLGRNDHQVKVRGYRIELGEIETALRAHPDIADCAVAVRRTATGVEQLAAYLIPGAPGREPDAAGLRTHLAHRLPPYMLPQSFTAIGEIPLTPNGKVDRDALPDPRPAGPAPAAREHATKEQTLVAEVWEQCLGYEGGFGPDDNFFDVGGNSLAVTAVAARLSERLGRRVSPVLVFRNPTLAGLAGAIEAAA